MSGGKPIATILVVDDDPLVLAALQDLLESEGYAVLTASSGRTGLKLYQEETPDLVITDILMPEMDGIETINEIRGLAPAQPIIAISGGGRIENRNLLRSVGDLLDVLAIAKPIRREQFLKSVAGALAA